MLIKICGIQTIEAAIAAIDSGADLLGFVFAPSKRRITAENAANIINSLPAEVQTVGVFVNETTAEMKRIANIAGLDYIQLHGDEPEETAKALSFKTIKAFPVTEKTLPIIKEYPSDYYILDSPIGGNRGGNGTTFDWDLVDDLPIDRTKIILAGGLNPENVATAIKRLNPIGIDVSSGVETNGIKNPTLIKLFIKNARNSLETK